jgi:hypothetical protein
MKRVRTQIMNNTSRDGFELHDVNGLIDAIETQMRTGTFRRRTSGRPVRPEKAAQVRAAWENANFSTEKFHTTFDSAAMTNLLKVRRTVVDGRVTRVFDLPPGFIRTRLFAKSDARFLGEAMESVGQDPNIRAAMAEELLKTIRKDVIKDGRVQGGLYNDAMSNYEDHMNLLFTPEQMGKITNLGSLGRVVTDAGMVVDQLTKRLTGLYGRTIADPTNPFNIAEEILGPRMTSKQVATLMRDVRAMDPRLGQQVEEKVMQHIFDVASKGDRTTIGFTSLHNMLKMRRDSLMAVGGRRYVRDLDNLRDTLEVLAESRFSKAAREELQGLWMRGTRLLFGPLGREQRFISAVGRMARASRGGAVSELLRNPDALRKFVKLKNLNVRDPRFWVGATALGTDILDMYRELDDEGNYDKFLEGTLPGQRRDRQEPF